MTRYHPSHFLYDPADGDAPQQVVSGGLACCRACGEYEAGLDAPCGRRDLADALRTAAVLSVSRVTAPLEFRRRLRGAAVMLLTMLRQLPLSTYVALGRPTVTGRSAVARPTDYGAYVTVTLRAGAGRFTLEVNEHLQVCWAYSVDVVRGPTSPLTQLTLPVSDLAERLLAALTEFVVTTLLAPMPRGPWPDALDRLVAAGAVDRDPALLALVARELSTAYLDGRVDVYRERGEDDE